MVSKMLRSRLEAARADDGADIGLALGGPHGAIAVGHLPLHDGWPEIALTGVVGGIDEARPSGEGQKLIAGSPELVLDVSRQIARRRRGDDGIETSLEGAAFGGDGRSGEAFDITRQDENLGQPEFEARGQVILACLDGEGDVAGARWARQVWCACACPCCAT